MLVPVKVDMFTAAFLRLTRMSVTAADVPQDGSMWPLCITTQWTTLGSLSLSIHLSLSISISLSLSLSFSLGSLSVCHPMPATA
jgi:hypothetical protein